MNRRHLTAVAVCAMVSALTMSNASAEKAESKEVKIKRAMSAGPAQISRDATVMDVDGTVLRKGSNDWVCMPSLMPGMDIPMCNDATWMKLMDALANKKPFATDQVGISYMFGGDMPTNNDDPYDTKQDPGEHWVTEGPHLMIIVPDKAALDGLPSDPDVGGPYVMWKDTPYAHIMVPIAARPDAKKHH